MIQGLSIYWVRAVEKITGETMDEFAKRAWSEQGDDVSDNLDDNQHNAPLKSRTAETFQANIEADADAKLAEAWAENAKLRALLERCRVELWRQHIVEPSSPLRDEVTAALAETGTDGAA